MNGITLVTDELSVIVIVSSEPERVRLNVPRNTFSLNTDLSRDTT